MIEVFEVGSRVRSFDFATPGKPWGRWLLGEHERAAYVEGELLGYVTKNGCLMAEILVDVDVFGNSESSARVGEHIFAPANGVGYGFGDEVCDFIEVIS